MGQEASSMPETLTLVLVASEEGRKDHYAVVPSPTTYEYATAAATKFLGKYMNDPSADIALRSSIKNRNGEWIWADIAPENWLITIKSRPKEVGVFELPKTTKEFQSGWLRFAFALEGDSKTSWSTESEEFDDLEGTQIDRPENYRDAIYRSMQIMGSALPPNYSVFKFCHFADNTTHSWIMFPAKAYTDDTVWRSVVPPPGGFLGVLVSRGN